MRTPVALALVVALVVVPVIACGGRSEPKSGDPDPKQGGSSIACSTTSECPAGAQCIVSPCVVAPCTNGSCYADGKMITR